MGDIAETTPARGTSHTTLRNVRCKDCLRELEQGLVSEDEIRFEYGEASAQRLVDRGGSRSDRCRRHRLSHRQAIQGIAVAYIDIDTIGEVADRANPSGPLGGLGELPAQHIARDEAVDLSAYQFGMTDTDIVEILELLEKRQFLILKAGTGTGKSTFFPFRLLNPPAEARFKLAKRGPIIMTEPRVQATIGVARFVGEKLVQNCAWRECSRHGWFEGDHPGEQTNNCKITDCARHIGPGYPVGYQVKGAKNHDESCQLIYATDGTVVNWLQQGRLSKFGAVIVDEAHERSSNIDFILGYLKREAARYPHLKVIVTSATFDVEFFVDYFGGPEKVASKEITSAKSYGYGTPLFPLNADSTPPCNCEEPHPPEITASLRGWIAAHWREQLGPALDDGYQEDLWQTTRVLDALRFNRAIEPENWRTEMPTALAQFVADLVKTLDQHNIYGDILAFLATEKTITPTVESIRKALPAEAADVYPLLTSADQKLKELALAPRPRGAKRKIVISTNIAETSLTVQGVRFVVDSGLICQEEWNPELAKGDFPTKPHSQAGLKQRWGRVGRDGPGWVFPLYTIGQFESLDEETSPGATRTNLEQLVMKAKAGGVDPQGFPWPASHTPSSGVRSAAAQQAAVNFAAEIRRSLGAAQANGILDTDGDLTPYGRELERFSSLGSAAFAVAIMFADQLTCLPEVVTALALMENKSLVGLPTNQGGYLLPENDKWPPEWRVQARMRHQALYAGCRDELDVVLRIAAAWERVDDRPAWEDSDKRRQWAQGWWVDHEVLLSAATKRAEIISELSARMNQEVTRPLEPRLVPRARAVLSRSLRSLEYVRQEDGTYRSAISVESDDAQRFTPMLARTLLGDPSPSRVIALRRFTDRRESTKAYLQTLVEAYPWAVDGSPDPMELIRLCSVRCAPWKLAIEDVDTLAPYLATWPIGARYLIDIASGDGWTRISHVHSFLPPFGYMTSTAALVESDGTDIEAPVGEDQLQDDDVTLDLKAEADIAADEASDVAIGWPGGTPGPVLEDETELRHRIVDSADPEIGMETNDDIDDTVEKSDRLEETEAWRQQVASTHLETPLVLVDEGPVARAAWMICQGYEVGDDATVKVVLSRSWLDPAVTGDPSTHCDLNVGAEIEVLVSPILSDGRSRFRALNRTDGRGRFLLPEVGDPRRGEPPIALDAYDREFAATLADGGTLTGVVVPGQVGTKGLSLLPLLRAHLDQAVKQSHPRPGDRAKQHVPYWPATVTKAPEGDRQWARVTLFHTDEQAGVRYTFGLRPDSTGIEEIRIAVGERVLVQLGAPVVSLTGNPKRLAEVAEKFPTFVRIRTMDSGASSKTELRALKPLTTGVRNALLDGLESHRWLQKVWSFYLSSYQLAVRSVLPGHRILPSTLASVDEGVRNAYRQLKPGTLASGLISQVRENGITVAFRGGITGFAGSVGVERHRSYTPGEIVLCRVHEVNAARGRLMLDLRPPYLVTADIPAHWTNGLQRHRSYIERQISGSIEMKNTTAELRFRTADDRAAGVGVITGLFQLPAGAITVEQSKKKHVIGKQGSYIRGLQQLPGVWSCDFDSDGTELTIIATSSQEIRDVISRIMEVVAGPVTGVMAAPAGATGRLIGKGGECVRGLKSQSACFAAEAMDGDTWKLTGPSETAVWRFVELSNQIAPGCELQSIATKTPPVLDLSNNAVVSDWQSHEFGHYSYAPPAVAALGKPLDLLPIDDEDR